MPRFKGLTMTVHLKQTLDVHSNLLLTDFVVQQQDLQEFLINCSQKIKTRRKKIRLLSPTKNTSTWRWEKFFYLLTKSPLFLCIRWAWWCWERGWFRDTWLILIIMMSFFLSRERVRLKNECDQQDCQVSAKAVSLCWIQMRRKKTSWRWKFIDWFKRVLKVISDQHHHHNHLHLKEWWLKGNLSLIKMESKRKMRSKSAIWVQNHWREREECVVWIMKTDDEESCKK